MSATIQGIDDLTTALEKLAESFSPEECAEIAALALEPIFDISQELVPVDTGELKESGAIEATEGGAQIIYRAGHAEHVEYGTSRMEAQPYLRPAVDAGTSAALEIVTEEINKRLE